MNLSAAAVFGTRLLARNLVFGMTSEHTGHPLAHPQSNRKLRFDDSTSLVHRHAARPKRMRGRLLARDHSGRLLVLAAGFTVLVIWGALNLLFRDWRARYRERAAYGAAMVLPAINPLAKLAPPGVDASTWRNAVGDTRSLLTTVIGSNLLNLREMEGLRTEIQQIVQRAQAQPGTACLELAAIWDSIGERGEFLLADSRSATGERHTRPRLLPSYGQTRVVPALDALDGIVPPGVSTADWHDAVERTRALFLTVTNSGRLSIAELRTLRAELDAEVARACAHPNQAVAILTTTWNQASRAFQSWSNQGANSGRIAHPKPKILANP
jgi:hypothetical protein